jgi:DNA-binding transcriptional LysR family regulator
MHGTVPRKAIHCCYMGTVLKSAATAKTSMVDLNELQYFVQLAKAQSFTRAARRMGVPKSSVSRVIGRLEARLGVRLVERTTRSMALTEAGTLYLDHCTRVIEEVENADLAMGALLATPRGRLRVAAPLPYIRFELAPLLGELLTEYPELRVSVQAFSIEHGARQAVPDITIWPGPPPDSRLLMTRLAEIRLGAYASPIYVDKMKLSDMVRVPGDLRGHDCITSECGAIGGQVDGAMWKLRRGTEIKEVRVDSRVAVPDPSIVHQLAVAGVGIGMLSHLMARTDVQAGRLVRLLPEWEPEPIKLHALYPTRLSSSPKVRAFLEFLRARMRKEFG